MGGGFYLAPGKWRKDAYLELGQLWLCLTLGDKRAEHPWPEYTHYAFCVSQEDFSAFVAKLIQAGVIEWQSNTSEGNSFYFLDPDGHKLEVHVGSLITRLSAGQAYAHLLPFKSIEQTCIFNELIQPGFFSRRGCPASFRCSPRRGCASDDSGVLGWQSP